MSFTLSRIARLKSNESSKEPQLVLEIDGVDTIYGSTDILKYIQVGDPGLLVGDGWKIGGLTAIEGQDSLIGFGSTSGTTTKISQTLDVEKGRGSSVSTMTIGLIDKDQVISNLIAPGNVVTDVMGRRARLYLGFKDTGYKRDFIPIFKGIIDDVSSGPGIVRIQLGSPEQKKRQDIFQKVQAELDGSINNSQTTITVLSTANFLDAGTKPDGSDETALKRYFRIDDEFIQYTGRTSTDFTGCTRGALDSTAAAHNTGTSVDSFYRLGPDNGVDLALKVMLGGWQDYFETDYPATNFVNISPTETVDNSIFFDGVDVEEELGITVGDYVTSAGAIDPSNDFTLKQITAVTKVGDSSYIEIDGVTLVSEFNTTTLLSFRSQYDTLPIGASLQMLPDDVDVAQHAKLKELFFTSFDLDIYLEDTVNGKEFIETELYVPGGMFSVPRKARSSVGIASGPIPGSDIVTLDETNVTNPTKLFVRRSLGKAFYNSVVYKYDQEPFDQKFVKSIVTVAADSLTRIPVGNRTLVVEAKGLRTDLDAENIVTRASNRRLTRYKYAAEMLQGVQVNYGVGFNLEVGDICVFDGVLLQVSDSTTGERGMTPRLMEITNKTIDIKSGQVSVDLLDTAFSVQNRYALIGPSSYWRATFGANQIQVDGGGYFSRFGADEGAKWRRFKRPKVQLRSEDSSQSEILTITNVTGNTITFQTALTLTPAAGWIMELTSYDDTTDQLKLIFGWMRDTPPFNDSRAQYLML